MNQSKPTHNNEHANHINNVTLITWIMLLFTPLLGMAIDLIAPSLPSMTVSLHVSESDIKHVISTYLLGYALGNFIMGLLSESLGRKWPLRINMLLFSVASFMPIVAPNINAILAVRLVQGLSLGASGILARSILSDILPSEKMLHLGTLLGTMWGLGPVIGPVIGGYLQLYFGYQACFIFFAIIGAILFIAMAIIVPETHHKRQQLNIASISNNIVTLLSSKVFMGTVLLMGFNYSLVITFHTAMPFFVENILDHSPAFFGKLALVMGSVFLGATFVCRSLLKHYSFNHVARTLIMIFYIVSIVDLGIGYLMPHSIIFLGIASALMFFFVGIMVPMSLGKSMSLFRHIASSAGAVLYLINVSTTSATSYVLSFVQIRTNSTTMWIYFAIMTTILVVWYILVHKPLTPQDRQDA